MARKNHTGSVYWTPPRSGGGKIKKHWNKINDAKPKKGEGRQRRFRGRMTLPNGSPRAHTHGGHSQANSGWESGQTDPSLPTKLLPGRYRVPEPTKRHQRHGIVRRATTGEQVR